MDKNRIIIYDLETPEQCFLASFYTPHDGFTDFLINKWQNDIYKLIRYVENEKSKWFCGYNNLRFDSQVIEFIYRNYEKWFDMDNLSISKLISEFASMEIDNNSYGLFSSYREENLTFNQIDLPCIWHFFNDKKRVSLKQLEFEMRAENIENIDFSLNQDFSYEEIYGEKGIISYCHNDCLYTFKHLEYTFGETSHPLYKGKNKFIDREIITSEVGLPCLNWDDVKIGAEWNKKDYISMTKRDENLLRPKEVNVFYGKKFKNFFPKTVEYRTEGMKSFVKEVGETFALSEKQEFRYSFNDSLEVTMAKGGLHSTEKSRIIIPLPSERYLQNDIGSQYPNALRKYNIYPSHLGREWNTMLKQKIDKRIAYKKLYKETNDPKYSSLQEMGKLSLNGGAYGRLNTKGDWQQDPCSMLKVTIGCQLEILMIVEALILAEFKIVSVNTDGFDSIVPKCREIEYFELLKSYEKKIGNEEMGNFEFTEFEWIAQTSVNDYAAKKKYEITYIDGKVIEKPFTPSQSDLFPDFKLKGDFTVDFELHKNSSFRMIPLAIVSYLGRGIDPEEMINNHTDIYDFCARSNHGKVYLHKAYDKQGNETSLPKLIRYYVAKEGMKLKKMVREGNDTGANNTNISPAEYPKHICNNLPPSSHIYHLNNINRQWYVDEVKKTIFLLENGKKPKRDKDNPNQINMF